MGTTDLELAIPVGGGSSKPRKRAGAAFRGQLAFGKLRRFLTTAGVVRSQVLACERERKADCAPNLSWKEGADPSSWIAPKNAARASSGAGRSCTLADAQSDIFLLFAFEGESECPSITSEGKTRRAFAQTGNTPRRS
jgi:hypothetical protein